MKQSTSSTQYIIQPPDVPEFLYKRNYQAWKQLIDWAKAEFQARLIYLSENGYWKELRNLNQNYSPMRILAEMSGYRKLCSLLSGELWNELTGRERVFIRRSFELRDILFR